MKKIMEKDFNLLEAYIQILPGNDSPPYSPFLSMAISINVATKAHRDTMDKAVCLVLALTNGTGGGLVLHEPGIVADLKKMEILSYSNPLKLHTSISITQVSGLQLFFTVIKNLINGWRIEITGRIIIISLDNIFY